MGQESRQATMGQLVSAPESLGPQLEPRLSNRSLAWWLMQRHWAELGLWAECPQEGSPRSFPRLPASTVSAFPVAEVHKKQK